MSNRPSHSGASAVARLDGRPAVHPLGSLRLAVREGDEVESDVAESELVPRLLHGHGGVGAGGAVGAAHGDRGGADAVGGGGRGSGVWAHDPMVDRGDVPRGGCVQD